MVCAFPFNQNLHSKKNVLHIYTAELSERHWKRTHGVRVIFQLLLVTIMTGDGGHQNACTRTNLMLLQSLIVKLKEVQGGRGRAKEGSVLCGQRRKESHKRIQHWSETNLPVRSNQFTSVSTQGEIFLSVKRVRTRDRLPRKRVKQENNTTKKLATSQGSKKGLERLVVGI